MPQLTLGLNYFFYTTDMKKLLIIFTLMSSIAFAQEEECPIEDCSTPIAFDFECDINPLELTDEEIETSTDRNALLQALVGLTTNNGNVISAVEYPTTTTVFIVKVKTERGSFTSNTSGYGKELILDEMLDENFREFYKNILNHALTQL